MKRKIIRLGHSTLVASMPVKWANKYHLKQGDEINIEERGREIIISTKKEIEAEKKEIDLVKLGTLKNQAVQATYFAGTDEVKVHSSDPKLIEMLELPLSQLIGFEITEQEKNSCTIRDLSGTTETDFKTIVRRLLLIIKNMGDDIEEAIASKKTNLEHLQSMNITSNRFAFLCLRNLNKQGYTEFQYTPTMYFIVNMLESLGDIYRDLAKYIVENRLRFGPESIKIYKEAHALYNEYQAIFFKFDIEKAAELDQRYRELKTEFDKLLKKISSKTETRAVAYMFSIADYVAQIFRSQLVMVL